MAKGIRQVKDVHSNIQDKQAEALKKSKVYSTARINLILEELLNGGAPDMDPFWHGQMQYRDQGITFEYTDEELEEIDKCANDPVYFVSNYCTFVNDKGRSLVKLREYQKRTLHLYGDEVYDPVSDTLIAKNRKIAIMQSRQTGKCLSYNSECETTEDITSIIASNTEKYSILHWIKTKLKQIFSQIDILL